MYNWSVDTGKIKENKEKYNIWRLEQLINLGLNGEKLDRKDLKKYLPKINIDPARKRFLELILSNERS